MLEKKIIDNNFIMAWFTDYIMNKNIYNENMRNNNFKRGIVNNDRNVNLRLEYCDENEDDCKLIEYKINGVVYISVSDDNIYKWTFNIGYSDDTGTHYNEHLTLYAGHIIEFEIIEEEGGE